MDIYTLPQVPGATETQEWTSFCHQREPFLTIYYSKYRNTSRWQMVERKRKFRVEFYTRPKMSAFVIGYYLTLENAQKAAQDWADLKARQEKIA